MRTKAASWTIWGLALATNLLLVASPGVRAAPSEEQGRRINTGLGPFWLESEAPMAQERLGVRVVSPAVLGKGRWRVGGALTTVNTFAWDQEDFQYLVDSESATTRLSVAVGLGAGLEISLEGDQRRRYGGILDPLIQGFHDLVGQDQSGRDLFPDGSFAIELTPLAGPSYVLGSEGKGDFARGLRVALQQQVTEGGSRMPSLGWRLELRESLVADDVVADSLDVSLTALAAKRWGRFVLYGNLGYMHWGEESFGPFPLAEDQVSFSAAFEWLARTERHAWLLQYLRNGGLLSSYRPFDEPSNEIAVGWKGNLGANGELEAAVIENFGTSTNTPDLGFHAAYFWRW